MADGASPEDLAVFNRMIQQDPENKKCFDCGNLNPNWCDINHAILVCLECSGQHRGLGVHISFVRSMTMDSWGAWDPNRLKQMSIGGNRRAREFFTARGVPKGPIRDRYEHRGALMYKEILECEVKGIPFNESTWVCPEVRRATRPIGQGFGSQGSAPPSNQSNELLESTTALFGKGWQLLSTTASTAGSVAMEYGQKGVSTVSTGVSNITTDEFKTKVTTSTTGALKSGWGMLSSLGSAVTKTVSEVVSGNDTDDGLSALTKNVQETHKYDGLGHVVEGTPSPVAPAPRSAPQDNAWGGGFDDDDDWGSAQTKKTPTMGVKRRDGGKSKDN